MKYLLIALLLTACNFGLVDIEEQKKTCYEIDYDFDITVDSVKIDSVAFECGSKRVTTPFDHLLDPVLKTSGDSGPYPEIKPTAPK